MWILYLFPATINLFIVLQIISKTLGSRLFYHLFIDLSDNLSNSTSSSKQIIELHQRKTICDFRQVVASFSVFLFKSNKFGLKVDWGRPLRDVTVVSSFRSCKVDALHTPCLNQQGNKLDLIIQVVKTKGHTLWTGFGSRWCVFVEIWYVKPLFVYLFLQSGESLYWLACHERKIKTNTVRWEN